MCRSRRRGIGRCKGGCRRERQCDGGGERRRRAGRIGWIQTDGEGVDAGCGFARVAVFIVDLDELDIRELLEVERERTRDVIERAIGLANSSEVDVRHAVSKLELAIACETI